MSIVSRALVIVLSGLLLVGMFAASASALYTTGPVSGSQGITMYGDGQNYGQVAASPANAVETQNVAVQQPVQYVQSYPAVGTAVPGYGYQGGLTGCNMPVTGTYGGYSPSYGYPVAADAVPVSAASIDVVPVVAAGCDAIPAPVAVPDVPVVTGGFTRTYTSNVAGGTFVPPQAEVTQSFYSHPGITPCGPYPGAGIASGFGIGFTPMGYGPYGGTIPLI